MRRKSDSSLAMGAIYYAYAKRAILARGDKVLTKNLAHVAGDIPADKVTERFWDTWKAFQEVPFAAITAVQLQEVPSRGADKRAGFNPKHCM